MTLYLPPGSAQTTLVFDIPGNAGPAMTTMAFTDIAAVSADDIAQNVWDAWVGTGGPMPLLNAAAVLTEVRVLKALSGGLFEGGLATGSVAGGDVLAGMTPQVAYLVHKVTAYAGRQNRGRLFVPGVSEQWCDDAGNIPTSRLATMQSAFDQFLTTTGTTTGPLTVLHNDPSTFLSDVLSLKVSAKVATQRRRLR